MRMSALFSMKSKGTLTLTVVASFFAAEFLIGADAAKKPAAAQTLEEKAFGREGDAKKVSRIVKVEMADTMRFTPAEVREPGR